MTTNTAARGVVIQMGGRDIRFLPLNWQQLEDLQVQLDIASNMDKRSNAAFFTKEERNAILDLATASITRSNEGVDAGWVRQNLDLANVGEVIRCIFNTNGFVDAPKPGDAAAQGGAEPGEAVAAGSGS